jgi:hypothetical protein
MRKTMLSMLSAFALVAVAGSASAGEALTADQLDAITAGGNIEVAHLAQAIVDYDITSNANHNVAVTANTYTNANTTIVVDASAVGNSTSQSVLTASVNNN